MAGLLGALAHGFAGAAKAGADIAKGYIDDERRVDLESQIMTLKEEARRRASEYDFSKEQERSPLRAQMKAEEADIVAKGALKTREDTADRTRAIAEGDAKAKAKVESDITKDQANDPDYLKSVRKIKQAGHIESAGSVAQAALATYQLDRAKLIGAAQDELATARKSGDPAKVKAATDTLEALNSKGDDPKGAKAKVEIGNGYRVLAKNAADAGDTEAAKEFGAKASTWYESAGREMNATGEDPVSPMFKPGNKKGGDEKPAPAPKKAADPAPEAAMPKTEVAPAVEGQQYELLGKHVGRDGVEKYRVAPKGKSGIIFQETISKDEAQRRGLI